MIYMHSGWFDRMIHIPPKPAEKQGFSNEKTKHGLTLCFTSNLMVWPYDLHVFPYLSVFALLPYPFWPYFSHFCPFVLFLLSSFFLYLSLFPLLLLRDWSKEGEENKEEREKYRKTNKERKKPKKTTKTYLFFGLGCWPFCGHWKPREESRAKTL